MVQICTARKYLTSTNRSKLKTGLKTSIILNDAASTNYIEPIILVWANPKFVYLRIDLMFDNNSKAQALHIYKDNTFPFIYDVKATILSEFLDLYICDMSNFRLETKIAVKLQVYAHKFKIKRREKNIGYFSKLISIYKLQEI